MDISHFYVAGSIAVGVLQMVDGAVMIARRGKLSVFGCAMSAVEMLWLVFSLVVLLRLVKNAVPAYLPLSLIVYHVVSLLHSTDHIKAMASDEALPLGEWIAPAWGGPAGLLFGAFFTIASFLLYRGRYM